MTLFRHHLWILCSCVVIWVLSIEHLHAQEAQHTFAFTQQPASSQALVLGGRIITYIDTNAGLAFENPALYGHESAGRLFLSYFNYMRGTHTANALYGGGVGERGTWALGSRVVYYGKMDGRDIHGATTGQFEAMEMSLQGLYSYDLTDRLRGGLALKTLYGHLAQYNALALVADVGLSYYDDATGRAFGLTINNIGGMLKNYGYSRQLPAWDIRIGFSQQMAHAPFRFHLTMYGLTPYNIKSWGAGYPTWQRFVSHFAGGIEFVPSESFWLGLGYNPRLAMDMSNKGGKSLSGLSAGIGFNQTHYQIGLGVAYYHPQLLGMLLSLSTTFGSDTYIY